MAYKAKCPKGHGVQVTEAHFNQQVDCPTCGESFVVPDLSAGPAASGGVKSAAASRGVPMGGNAMLTQFSLLAGRPMLAIGLLLVLFSRGCDILAKRGLESVEAREQAAKNKFEEKMQSERLTLENQLAAIEDRATERSLKEDDLSDLLEKFGNAKPEERKEIQKQLETLQKSTKEAEDADRKETEKIQKSLSKLKTKQRMELRKFENGEYRNLVIASRNASTNDPIWGWWRELFFVFATLLLTLGLLAVSWTAQGPERLVCLIMLAIVTFSVYIAGIAWLPIPM